MFIQDGQPFSVSDDDINVLFSLLLYREIAMDGRATCVTKKKKEEKRVCVSRNGAGAAGAGEMRVAGMTCFFLLLLWGGVIEREQDFVRFGNERAAFVWHGVLEGKCSKMAV